MQRLKFYAEQWAWFVVRRQVRLIRKFRISPSLSNRFWIVRFEFESNLEASHVPVYWNLQPIGRSFKYRPLCMLHVNDRGQVVHKHCLCLLSSINWYRCRLWAKQALHTTYPCPWNCSFGWCLAEGYRNGDQRRTMDSWGSGRTLVFLVKRISRTQRLCSL